MQNMKVVIDIHPWYITCLYFFPTSMLQNNHLHNKWPLLDVNQSLKWLGSNFHTGQKTVFMLTW